MGRALKAGVIQDDDGRKKQAKLHLHHELGNI